ncbi:MAG: 3-oxoacyl-[acyl-carrier-protein] reductase [Fibrobacterota bacterium]
MKDLESMSALVTGAGRGIGRAVAARLAQSGASVAVCDLDKAAAGLTAEEIKNSTGAKTIALECDVSSAEAVKEMYEEFKKEFGVPGIIVNNAGITRDQLLMRMKEADWDTVLSVNLRSAFLCTKAAMRDMLKARTGRIVNIASVIGLTGNAGQANYAASKAGLIGFTKSVAKECAPRGITVNAVAPGFIKTKMTEALPENEKKKILDAIPAGKMGSPADVAEAVKFLASPSASYITGQVITVDGGMVMH